MSHLAKKTTVLESLKDSENEFLATAWQNFRALLKFLYDSYDDIPEEYHARLYGKMRI